MRSSREGDTFRKLKKAGYELDSPEDDFSEQPDSGGRIGGKRGVNEYGISGGISEIDSNESELRSGYSKQVSGERVEDETVDYLREKLGLLPSISEDDVNVSSDEDTVIIYGNVDSLDIKDQASKVASQILQDRPYLNQLEVRS